VLVETFCEGRPIMDFVRNNTENQSVLRELCTYAIEAVCQMIFLDNFVSFTMLKLGEGRVGF
jgi:hypothetical protein